MYSKIITENIGKFQKLFYILIQVSYSFVRACFEMSAFWTLVGCHTGCNHVPCFIFPLLVHIPPSDKRYNFIVKGLTMSNMHREITYTTKNA